MHHQHDAHPQLTPIRDYAVRIAFPGWQPTPGDWTHLYTGFQAGKPYTDVAVYRPSKDSGHERIHYRRYAGDDLTAFWIQLTREISHNAPM
ncbi:hypothetical protein [Nonomuraea sp. NPDC049400]|uniref:hypothetical protein n=1 Tax=Nonomuraea sp. NPDC049400 TaxID=3364352 RepID=UPI0037A89594